MRPKSLAKLKLFGMLVVGCGCAATLAWRFGPPGGTVKLLLLMAFWLAYAAYGLRARK